MHIQQVIDALKHTLKNNAHHLDDSIRHNLLYRLDCPSFDQSQSVLDFNQAYNIADLTLFDYIAMANRGDLIHAANNAIISGYNIDLMDNALHYAARFGCHDAIEALTHYLPINHINDQKQTPLHIAHQYSNHTTVELLINRFGAIPPPTDVNKHIEIAKLIRGLGYDISPDGVCFGLSEMAKQACLIDSTDTAQSTQPSSFSSLDTFIARLTFLKQIKPYISHYTTKRTVFVVPQLAEDIYTQHVFLRVKQDYEQRGLAFPLPQDLYQTLVDLQGFLENVALYQQPELGIDLTVNRLRAFFQAKPLAIDYVLPDKLKADPPQSLLSFSTKAALQNTQTLQQYLSEIYQLCESHSFALDIFNHGHRIELSYDQNQQKWYLIDDYNLTMPTFSNLLGDNADSNQLSGLRDTLYHALWPLRENKQTTDTEVQFSTQVFTNTSHARQIALKDLTSTTNPINNLDDDKRSSFIANALKQALNNHDIELFEAAYCQDLNMDQFAVQMDTQQAFLDAIVWEQRDKLDWLLTIDQNHFQADCGMAFIDSLTICEGINYAAQLGHQQIAADLYNNHLQLDQLSALARDYLSSTDFAITGLNKATQPQGSSVTSSLVTLFQHNSERAHQPSQENTHDPNHPYAKESNNRLQ